MGKTTPVAPFQRRLLKQPPEQKCPAIIRYFLDRIKCYPLEKNKRL
jgi:hypothetical protein